MMLYPFSRLCRPARSPASCGPALRKKRGFNLIESAVVLGVVGLVIGGIWVAAASFNQDKKIDETVSGILTIVKNVQNLISFSDAQQIGDGNIMNSTLIASSAIPQNWVNGTSIKNPFGGDVRIYNYVNANPVLGTNINFYLFDIPYIVCEKLVVRLSSIGSMAGSRGYGSWARDTLGHVTTYKAGFITISSVATFPITPVQAAGMCPTDMSILRLGFGYTRIN